MNRYKCENCGGDIREIESGIGKCTYCNAIWPIPKNVTNKLERANRLLYQMKCFDEAERLYEEILNEEPSESYASWGRVLCRYGIEYVDEGLDILVPTCHRTIEKPIFDDIDYIDSVINGTMPQKQYYKEQAAIIDGLQKKILEIVRKEPDYDIFISYKAKDTDNLDTTDSKNAQKIFYTLKNQGYRVFFAEETLKSKTGIEYEPIIYAALNSAKVMILIAGSIENIEAVWVKNEWSRYLEKMKDDTNKRLMTVYYDIDPASFPNQLMGLQAINWRDAEAMETLKDSISGIFDGAPKEENILDESYIEKAINNREQKKAQDKYDNAVNQCNNGNYSHCISIVDDLLKDDPAFAEAYWLRLAARHETRPDGLKNVSVNYEKDPDFLQAIRLSSPEKREEYNHCCSLSAENERNVLEYRKEFEVIKNSFCSFNNTAVDAKANREKIDSINRFVSDDSIFNQMRVKASYFVYLIISISIVCIKAPLIIWVNQFWNGLSKTIDFHFIDIDFTLMASFLLIGLLPLYLSLLAFAILPGIVRTKALVTAAVIAGLYQFFYPSILGNKIDFMTTKLFESKATAIGVKTNCYEICIPMFLLFDVIYLIMIIMTFFRRLNSKRLGIKYRKRLSSEVEDYRSFLLQCRNSYFIEQEKLFEKYQAVGRKNGYVVSKLDDGGEYDRFLNHIWEELSEMVDGIITAPKLMLEKQKFSGPHRTDMRIKEVDFSTSIACDDFDYDYDFDD